MPLTRRHPCCIYRKSDIGGRLSDKDDEAVQAVLAFHPNLTEKTGCGVAYIKVANQLSFYQFSIY